MLALRVASIVFPVFAIIALGFWYGRRKQPELGATNQISMDILVPALVFTALASKSFDFAQYHWLALGGALVVLGSGVLAYPFARWLGVAPKTFVPPMMFNNSGNMGIPVLLLAFGDAALGAAVVLFLVEMVLHFSLGAWLLDRHAPWRQLLRTPVMLATLAGAAVGVAGLSLPAAVATAIKMVGDASIPMLLFALGVRMNQVSLRDWRVGVAGAVLCPLTGVALVWLLARWLPLPAAQQSYLVIFGALPPAVLNYLMAEQYRQEPERVASLVLLGNLGALISMPVALAFVLG
jgi:malate permease and related proteins